MLRGRLWPERLGRVRGTLNGMRGEDPRSGWQELVRARRLRTIDPGDARERLTQNNGYGAARHIAGGDRGRRAHWTATAILPTWTVRRKMGRTVSVIVSSWGSAEQRA